MTSVWLTTSFVPVMLQFYSYPLLGTFNCLKKKKSLLNLWSVLILLRKATNLEQIPASLTSSAESFNKHPKLIRSCLLLIIWLQFSVFWIIFPCYGSVNLTLWDYSLVLVVFDCLVISIKPANALAKRVQKSDFLVSPFQFGIWVLHLSIHNQKKGLLECWNFEK